MFLISDHLLQYDQPITFDNSDILASDSSELKPPMKESLVNDKKI